MRLRGERTGFEVRLRVIKGYHNPDVAENIPENGLQQVKNGGGRTDESEMWTVIVVLRLDILLDFAFQSCRFRAVFDSDAIDFK